MGRTAGVAVRPTVRLRGRGTGERGPVLPRGCRLRRRRAEVPSLGTDADLPWVRPRASPPALPWHRSCRRWSASPTSDSRAAHGREGGPRRAGVFRRPCRRPVLLSPSPHRGVEASRRSAWRCNPAAVPADVDDVVVVVDDGKDRRTVLPARAARARAGHGSSACVARTAVTRQGRGRRGRAAAACGRPQAANRRAGVELVLGPSGLVSVARCCDATLRARATPRAHRRREATPGHCRRGARRRRLGAADRRIRTQRSRRHRRRTRTACRARATGQVSLRPGDSGGQRSRRLSEVLARLRAFARGGDAAGCGRIGVR